jgi:hypothetical protein
MCANSPDLVELEGKQPKWFFKMPQYAGFCCWIGSGSPGASPLVFCLFEDAILDSLRDAVRKANGSLAKRICWGYKLA